MLRIFNQKTFKITCCFLNKEMELILKVEKDLKLLCYMAKQF